MDVYLGYNQIIMYSIDAPNMMFMSNHSNYYYNILPFGVKNTDATCHRIMDVVFARQIGHNLKIYIGDIIMKTSKGGKSCGRLGIYFGILRDYNMYLNPA